MPGDARRVPGLHPVRELLRAGAEIEAVHVAPGRRMSPVLEDIQALAAAAGVPVRTADRGALDALAAGVAHQGVVAVAAPYRYADLDDLLTAVPDDEAALVVALDGVTDPHNLGSIARTAEAVGADGLVVAARRAAGVTPAAEKAAAGALAHLRVARVANLVRGLKDLAELGLWSVGLDADGPTRLYDCGLLAGPLAVVVGSEGRGLSRLVAETCDDRAHLPMRGEVASLNASVAAAVALFEVRRQRDLG